MAGRPPKTNIEYAGWDVGIFDNEPKIDKLLDAQGCAGFVIYFYLCQKAYGSHGYYYSWCYDDSATTARKIGGGVGAQSVEETVKVCLRIGLFDKGLFERWSVLTSRGIQRRYAVVALTRTYKTVIREYWLLDQEESAGFNYCTLNSDLSPHNANYTHQKSNYSGSKVKESKVNHHTIPRAREEVGSDDHAIRCYSVYARLISIIEPRVHDAFDSLLREGMEDEAICAAIEHVYYREPKDKHNLRYLEVKLTAKLREGIKTRAAFEASEERWANRGAGKENHATYNASKEPDLRGFAVAE